jgi:hypothetical protein
MGEIWVHVVPGGRANEIIGMHGDAIRIRVAARPQDGAANAELLRFVAGALGVAKGAVTITAGFTSRRKRIRVDGMDASGIARSLLAKRPATARRRTSSSP